DPRRGLRRRVLGHRLLAGPRRRRARRHALGPSTRSVLDDQRPAREHRLPPRRRAPRRGPCDAGSRRGRRRRGARRAGRPLPDAAGQPHGVDRTAPCRRGPALADEGCGARHAQAHERGHRRGQRGRPGAHRRPHRSQPRRRDRPPGAGCQRRGLPGGGGRGAAEGVAQRSHLQALLVGRRDRLRARRRLQERHRARGRHGDRPRVRRQHHGVGHHPWPRRDRPPRRTPGSGPADPHGARRSRRPRGHLLLSAVTEPRLRGGARPGKDHRGHRGLDPPGRRGRQVVRVAVGARAGQRRLRAARRGGVRRGRRADDCPGHDRGLPVTADQARAGL
ncbi:MAG: Glycerol-3-phosphate dehydrogenase [NAD(P)+], partial [uncultured Nocardioidaceae bacterium]